MPTLILGSVPGRILRIQEIRPIAFVYGPGPRSPADLSVCPAGITLQVKHAHPQDRALWLLKIPCHVRFHRRAVRGAVRWYIFWLDGCMRSGPIVSAQPLHCAVRLSWP